MMVVVGKDKTDGTKKKKNTKGGQGEKVLGSKPARTQGLDSSRASLSRASRFFPVASQHQVLQDLSITRGAIVCAFACSRLAAAERTHTCVRHGAAQHSLSSNTQSQHTFIPLFVSCSSVLVYAPQTWNTA